MRQIDPVGSIKSQRLETTNSAKRQCNRGVQFDLVDESYQEFLKFLENGQYLEYTPEDGKKVTYEESDSESQVMILDTNPFSDGEPTPLVCIISYCWFIVFIFICFHLLKTQIFMFLIFKAFPFHCLYYFCCFANK